jgi:hypothetical protein
MVYEPNYIDPEIVDKIKDTAAQTGCIEDVIQDFADLKPSGISRVGECPHCHSKKLHWTPSKKIAKCFQCQKSAVDAIGFLTNMVGKTYKEALLYVAEKYSIELKQAPSQRNTYTHNPKESFRDAQLRSSGIGLEYQKIYVYEDDTTQIQVDRYQAGSIDGAWNIIHGNDMVLHYFDLDGKVMKYTDDRGKQRPLIRVRWSNPSNHRDKAGNEIKYQSARASGSHLWIPNWIMSAYKQATEFDTLYITEGEKKSDKLCLTGLPAVGIMGISNFTASGEMPHQFEMIVTRCKVKRVVFVLDADWQDISTKTNKPVDQRPLTFFKAVLKFRDYFYSYHNVGIDLRIYFAYHKEKMYKGIDDLVTFQFQTEEKQVELVTDFDAAMIDREGTGQYVMAHDITELSTYKLKEYWHLHSTPAFLNKHKEALKSMREFELGNIKRRYNAEDDDFEMAQAILPHEQFWKIEEFEDRTGRQKKTITYLYEPALHFLFNRGYGMYEHQPNAYRFIQVLGKVIYETTPLNIRKYVLDFAREIGEMQVLEALHRGGKQFLGPDNLSSLFVRQMEFNKAEKNCMYLYFQNCYWKITKDEIITRPLSELPAHIWENNLIKFEPELIGSLCQFDRVGDTWAVKFHPQYKECDMAAFFEVTSDFNWQKRQTLVEKNDQKVWVQRADAGKPTEAELQEQLNNMLSKMLATGYIAHDYRDYGNMKAIVAMDGVESEVGKSQGGTGKSIWGKQFQHIFPIAVIDGKKKNIEDDNFLYEAVDERTGAIVFDDVRVNFNFEFLFSQITTGVTVNKKGEKQFTIQPPKFMVITNHALNGDGNSFSRRQYQISFSDFFNGNRTVADYFGHQLFYDWDFTQWNLFYNWMATCIQHYLKHGLSYGSANEELHRRKLRQQIGENFLDWCGIWYDTSRDAAGKLIGPFVNRKVNKLFVVEKYLEAYPNDRKYIDARSIKQRLLWYAEYSKLEFNPTTKGERIKSNGREYFILADEHFDASTTLYSTIDGNGDMNP